MAHDVSLLLHKIQKNIAYLIFVKKKYHDHLNEQKRIFNKTMDEKQLIKTVQYHRTTKGHI